MMGKVYRFETRQHIHAPLETVWDFMSSQENLKKITPEFMNMEVLDHTADGKMYAGMIICYKVSPVRGLRLRWVTEITHVSKPNYFVDEQRFGPYSFWHHKHFMEET